MSTELANWKKALVDEQWKLDVVEAAQRGAVRVITGLNGILFAARNPACWYDWRAQTDMLRGLSGDQIADALNNYFDKTSDEVAQGKARGFTVKLTTDVLLAETNRRLLDENTALRKALDDACGGL